VPKLFQRIPAITLAGRRAIPATVDCRPSIVPLSSGEEISATYARYTPAIMAVYTP
jgi:hypothetical protein